MKKALIIVDVQNDFLPGGNLAVKNGNQVIPVLNEIMQSNFDVIVATKDWHPKNHGSFATTHNKKPGEKIILDGLEQILWPEHCIQDTSGAQIADSLQKEKIQKIFYKGSEKNIDSYSTFFDNAHRRSTGLGDYLKQKNIQQVYIAGLATDYCVKYSVLDAISLGFDTHVIVDACRAVNLQAHDEQKALKSMKEAGAHLITSYEMKRFVRNGSQNPEFRIQNKA